MGLAALDPPYEPPTIERPWLLLGERNCIDCHKPEGGQESHLPRKQVPILAHVWKRRL